ncbi:MAG: succinate dehydrogenase, hydrophobic membrane anchor protein [Rhodospirillales bacterium]
MEMRSPLSRVRGLGAAHEGVAHWWAQRLTGIALVPLTLWFIWAVSGLLGADLAAMTAWVGTGQNAVLLILLIVSGMYHAQLGLQVVVEDYVHAEGAKTVTLILIKLGAIFLGVINIFAVLKLTFGS